MSGAFEDRYGAVVMSAGSSQAAIALPDDSDSAAPAWRVIVIATCSVAGGVVVLAAALVIRRRMGSKRPLDMPQLQQIRNVAPRISTHDEEQMQNVAPSISTRDEEDGASYISLPCQSIQQWFNYDCRFATLHSAYSVSLHVFHHFMPSLSFGIMSHHKSQLLFCVKRRAQQGISSHKVAYVLL